jgi:hypothetical protein
MTQPDYWSTLPAPAASPLVTVPSLASLTPQPENRSFYRRPLFLILVGLGVLAVLAAVLFGAFGSSVKVSSPLHVRSPIQVTDSYTAKLQSGWDALTPEQKATSCLVLNSVGVDNATNVATGDDGAPLTADQKVKAASFIRAQCK